MLRLWYGIVMWKVPRLWPGSRIRNNNSGSDHKFRNLIHKTACQLAGSTFCSSAQTNFSEGLWKGPELLDKIWAGGRILSPHIRLQWGYLTSLLKKSVILEWHPTRDKRREWMYQQVCLTRRLPQPPETDIVPLTPIHNYLPLMHPLFPLFLPLLYLCYHFNFHFHLSSSFFLFSVKLLPFSFFPFPILSPQITLIDIFLPLPGEREGGEGAYLRYTVHPWYYLHIR